MTDADSSAPPSPRAERSMVSPELVGHATNRALTGIHTRLDAISSAVANRLSSLETGLACLALEAASLREAVLDRALFGEDGGRRACPEAAAWKQIKIGLGKGDGRHFYLRELHGRLKDLAPEFRALEHVQHIMDGLVKRGHITAVEADKGGSRYLVTPESILKGLG